MKYNLIIKYKSGYKPMMRDLDAVELATELAERWLDNEQRHNVMSWEVIPLG